MTDALSERSGGRAIVLTIRSSPPAAELVVFDLGEPAQIDFDRDVLGTACE